MARVAAVDCGTNSIRLLVADVTGPAGAAARRPPRDAGRAARAGRRRDRRARPRGDRAHPGRPRRLHRGRCARKGVERVRMVATSATRDAANRDDFFAMVRGHARRRGRGHLRRRGGPALVRRRGRRAGSRRRPVRGRRRRRRLHRGRRRRADARPDRSCTPPARWTSAACGSPSAACPTTRPPPSRSRRRARWRPRSSPAPFAAVPVEGVRTWVGVSGTVTTLSALALDLPAYDPDVIHLSRLSLPDLHRVTADLLAMPREQRAALGPMHPGRVDVIGGGAIIVEELARGLARGRHHRDGGQRARHPRRHRPLAGVTVTDPATTRPVRRAPRAGRRPPRAGVRLAGPTRRPGRRARRLPRLPPARRLAGAGRRGEARGLPRRGVLGTAGARLRAGRTPPLLIVGLAPAAHGANRTGRMFTGDRSGEVLYAALHAVGSGQPADLLRTR